MFGRLNIIGRNRTQAGRRLLAFMIVVAVVLLAGLVHTLSIYWFRLEIQRQASKTHASRPNKPPRAVARAAEVNQALEQNQPERQSTTVNLNSEIIAVLVVNADARFRHPREETGRFSI